MFTDSLAPTLFRRLVLEVGLVPAIRRQDGMRRWRLQGAGQTGAGNGSMRSGPGFAFDIVLFRVVGSLKRASGANDLLRPVLLRPSTENGL